MYEIKPNTKKAPVLVHSMMKYRCIKCHKSWFMYIEKGLEEHGPDHKPVPFCIRCKCGGTASDISGMIRIPFMESGLDYIELPKGEGYFANRKKERCGVPVLPNKELKLFGWM